MTGFPRDALVIDGLNFHGDGDPSVLRQAGIGAVNLTVSHFEGDFEQAMDGIGAWLEILRRPDCGWRRIGKAADLDAARKAGQVGLIMGWQNLRPIGDRLDRLVTLQQCGLRVAQLTYNRRNFLGDGCLEPEDGGLSGLGREALALMNEVAVAIDLSHVGQRTSVEAAQASTRPVLATHANARAVRPALPNKSADATRAIADSGGVIGVSIYGPMCWDGDAARHPGLDDFERHLDHIVALVGADHVGLGTDLPAAQSAFIRYAIGLLFVAPLLIRVGRDAVRPGTFGLHLGRAVAHTGGVALWFYALARSPVAEVAAVGGGERRYQRTRLSQKA